MTGKLEVRMRRVYDDPSPADGTRVHVDRIWPRGLAKATARIDEWAKVVAPSTELAEPDRQAAVHHLRELARSGPLTLLTATRDIDHSQAAVLVRHLHGAR